MTSKELLYIDGILAQQKQMITICNEFLVELRDPELKSFVQEMITKNRELFGAFYGVLSNKEGQ